LLRGVTTSAGLRSEYIFIGGDQQGAKIVL
jgi:hypothetical protein